MYHCATGLLSHHTRIPSSFLGPFPSLPHPFPILILKHMTFNLVPSQSQPPTPSGDALAAMTTSTRPGSHKCLHWQCESDERFQLAPHMELHENMIAPIYKQSHSNLQFEPCSSSHADRNSEHVEGDYHYDSFGAPVVSTVCRDPNEFH
jgi:hypothetical protein